MITYYATTPHCYPFELFVERWQPELAGTSATVGYSRLDLAAAPTPGLHVLTDFERLRPDELALAARLRTRLQAPGHRVVGDPAAWPDRHTLLARLHEAGINDFRAWRVDELGRQVRFPVFLRWADQHSGAIGPPIPDRRTLRRRINRARAQHPEERVAQHLLVVEQVDARSEDGFYRKYSVARIGDHYVPRHLVVARSWVTKVADVVTDEIVAEERRYLDDTPDLDVVVRAFELGQVEYGRIDLGYVDGRLQVWEINSNPMLAPRHRTPGPREALQLRQSALVREALESMVPAPLPGADRRPWLRWPERRRWQRVVAASVEADADRPGPRLRTPAAEPAEPAEPGTP